MTDSSSDDSKLAVCHANGEVQVLLTNFQLICCPVGFNCQEAALFMQVKMPLWQPLSKHIPTMSCNNVIQLEKQNQQTLNKQINKKTDSLICLNL